jgi:hypothetical protein
MNIKNKLPWPVAAFVIGLFACPAGISAQKPLLFFDFNESTAISTSKGSVPEKMRGMGAKQRAGRAGSGVSGKKTDRCWDASANTACGVAKPINNSRLATATNVKEMNDLKALTITMWYASDQFMGDAVRLVYKADNLSAQKKGVMVRGLTTDYLNGKLALWVRFGDGRRARAATSDYFDAGQGYNTYGNEGKWVFMAITWDGENVQFYHGGKDAGVKTAGYPTKYAGAIAPHDGPLVLGNAESANRGFDGRIDNFRLYDAALTIEQLEEIRSKEAEG